MDAKYSVAILTKALQSGIDNDTSLEHLWAFIINVLGVAAENITRTSGVSKEDFLLIAKFIIIKKSDEPTDWSLCDDSDDVDDVGSVFSIRTHVH